MDIEVQLAFLDKKIQESASEQAAYQAIRDTISDKIAPRIASVDSLEAQIISLQTKP